MRLKMLNSIEFSNILTVQKGAEKVNGDDYLSQYYHKWSILLGPVTKSYEVLYYSLPNTKHKNSTPPRYLINIRYSAIIRGPIVGQRVAQYLT